MSKSTKKQEVEAGSDKEKKLKKLNKVGRSRMGSIDAYRKKLKKMTPKERQIMRLDSAIKIFNNSLKNIPEHKTNPVRGVWTKMIEIANSQKEILVAAEDYEFTTTTFYTGEKVRLRGKYTGTDLESFAGKVIKITDVLENGECIVSNGRNKIQLSTTQLIRVGVE